MSVFHNSLSSAPKLGEDGVVSEARPLPEGLLPVSVGLRRQTVVYSCLDASQHYLVVGSLQGYVWVVDLKSMGLLREFTVSQLVDEVARVTLQSSTALQRNYIQNQTLSALVSLASLHVDN